MVKLQYYMMFIQCNINKINILYLVLTIKFVVVLFLQITEITLQICALHYVWHFTHNNIIFCITLHQNVVNYK